MTSKSERDEESSGQSGEGSTDAEEAGIPVGGAHLHGESQVGERGSGRLQDSGHVGRVLSGHCDAETAESCHEDNGVLARPGVRVVGRPLAALELHNSIVLGVVVVGDRTLDVCSIVNVFSSAVNCLGRHYPPCRLD